MGSQGWGWKVGSPRGHEGGMEVCAVAVLGLGPREALLPPELQSWHGRWESFLEEAEGSPGGPQPFLELLGSRFRPPDRPWPRVKPSSSWVSLWPFCVGWCWMGAAGSAVSSFS